MTHVLELAISTAAVALWWYRYRWVPTPDGGAYLVALGGHPCPSPFRWRLWPRPRLRDYAGVPAQPATWGAAFESAKGGVVTWRWQSWVALVGSAMLVAELAERHGVPRIPALLLFVTLPWFRGLVRNPVLTDQIAMMFALGAAVAQQWWAVAAFSLCAGRYNERAPVFAAVFAWSPLPLVGLLLPALAYFLAPHTPLLPWLRPGRENSMREQRNYHGGAALWSLALPWGACLLSVQAMTWQLGAALALGYAQLLVAHDRVRLYQWGAPVACIVTAGLLGTWWPLAILMHTLNPWGERQS